MKPILLSAAAALALALPAGVTLAQTSAPSTMASTDSYTMTSPQQTMYDEWPADRRTTYDGWPNTYQEYYWSLTPAQQGGWWVLNDDQRSRIYAMTPEQRSAAWTAIAAQMNAQTTGTSTASNMAQSNTAQSNMAQGTSTMSSGTSTMSNGRVQFVSKEMAQPVTQRSAAAVDPNNLPVCTANQQDGCINSWEKNKTGTKPLDHWPGRPASEM